MCRTVVTMRSILLIASAAVAVFAVACAEAPADGNPVVPEGSSPDCSQTPYATGCQGTKKEDEIKDTPTTPRGDDAVVETPDRTCEAKTCEDFDGACGEHDDGCGKKFSCGECAPKNPDCKKKTCDTLGVTCGNHDDGCGGTVACGTCATACATDAKEPNNTINAASNIGKFADTEDKTIEVKGLSSADGDEDWFTMDVTDEGFGGNPRIEVTSTDAKLEVGVFLECTSLPNYSYCDSDGKQDNAKGFGCTNMGKTTLKADCKGLTDSGKAWIRVRKGVSDQACHSYDLKVYVY